MVTKYEVFPKIMSIAGQASVRVKIMGMFVSLVLLLGLWNTMQLNNNVHEIAIRQLTKQGVSLAGDIAARSTDLIFTNDRFGLYQLVANTVDYNEDVRYVFILDGLGNVVANSFGSGLPEGLQLLNKIPGGQDYSILTLQTDEGLIYDVAAPIFEGKAGTVRVGMTERALQKLVSNSVKQVLLATAVIGLLGIVAASFLTSLLTNPIRQMVEAAQKAEHSDYRQQVKVWWGRDELQKLGQAFNKMMAGLQRAHETRTNLLKKIINAQEEERRRIARELHDETSQSLTTLMIGLKIIEDCQSLEEVRQKVIQLRTLTNETLEEIHDLALALRPSVLDDHGLVAALGRYTAEFAGKVGLDIDFHTESMEGVRLPPEIEISIYRVVQEALTNVAKYARATEVSVILARQGNSLSAIIEDDGVGFDVQKTLNSPFKEKRLGLYGMQERVGLTGGNLTIESVPGAGTTIYAQFELEGFNEKGQDQSTVG